MARSIKIGSCIGLVLTLGGAAVWNIVDRYRSYRYVKVREEPMSDLP